MNVSFPETDPLASLTEGGGRAKRGRRECPPGVAARCVTITTPSQSRLTPCQLSRMKSTDHAELIATILFSYDELSAKGHKPTDFDVFNHVLSWKPHWRGKREDEIRNTVFSLCTLRYMTPVYSGKLFSLDEDV